MWRKFMCGALFMALGCESAPQKSADEVPESTPAESTETGDNNEASAMEKKEGEPAAASQGETPGAELIPLPAKVLDALPLMEEYHSLSMVWNGTGETSRVLYAKPERDADPVGKITVDDKTLDAVESLDQMVVRVIKPRPFTAKKDMTWRVDAGEGDQDVAIETGDSVYLYAYQGEGMCEVGFRDSKGTPVFGTAVCPDMGDGEWTTPPGDSRLAEGMDWWFEVKNAEGTEGWVVFELSEMKLELVQDKEP